MKRLLSLFVMITVVIANASADTELKIKCTDESAGKCITLYFPTGTVTIPGKTYSKETTNNSFTPCSPEEVYSNNAFIHDPSNENIGTGFVNADVCTNMPTREGKVYSNSSTTTYSAYAVWLAAVSQ